MNKLKIQSSNLIFMYHNVPNINLTHGNMCLSHLTILLYFNHKSHKLVCVHQVQKADNYRICVSLWVSVSVSQTKTKKGQRIVYPMAMLWSH